MDLSDKITDKKKQFLVDLFSEVFYSCDLMIRGVQTCDTFSDFKELMRNNAEEVAVKLGFDTEFSQEIEDLEDEVEDLEHRIHIYERDKEISNVSLIDDWKFEIFRKYFDDFTPLQLEKRLS